MIQLKDLLKINKMKYSDEIKKKHQKKISMQTKLIDSEMRIPEKPFPDNSSRETRDELQWLSIYNNGIIDKDVVKEGDEILPLFENYCKDNNLTFNKKYYKEILKESTKTILSMKYHYNRPRPYQLAEYYGIKEFEDFEMTSMKTPSYPSGHSTQGHLVAELLGKKYPQHYDEFKKIADFITKSRLMARAHFPSDCIFGEEVAKHILSKVIQNDT
tara:strand:+ start:145 stop:789 length:645 start_codon:yes stop_codon:yes gene_type:complete